MKTSSQSTAPSVQHIPSFKNIQLLIWLYFWLLIFEGALRKWVAPQLSAPLLIIRDPVAIAAYLLALRAGVFPKDIFTKAIIFISSLTFLGGLATVVTSGNHLTVTLFGLRSNFLHLPLIFLIPKVFHLQDVKKLGKWVLVISILMATLMVVQFNAPPTDFINRTAGTDEAQQITSAMGKIRPPATFSFVTGVAQYFSWVASFLLYGLVQNKIYPIWLLCASGLSTVVALAVSGSRATVGSVTVVLASLAAILLLRPRLIGKSYKFIILLVLLNFGVSSIPAFSEGIEVLSARMESASEFEADTGGFIGRFFSVFLEPFDSLDELPLLGYGLGMGTNVGAALLTGKPQFLLPEGEWARVVFESGPAIGLLYVLLRITIVSWMGWVCIKNAIAGNILPLLLLGSSGLLLLNGQFSRSSDIGFAVLGAGLCLASTKSTLKTL